MQTINNPTTNFAGCSPCTPEARQRTVLRTSIQMIFSEVIDGVTYYMATRGGVSYTAYAVRGEWAVVTRRLALGRFNPGGCKYFPNIKALSESVKAFSGLDVFLETDPTINLES